MENTSFLNEILNNYKRIIAYCQYIVMKNLQILTIIYQQMFVPMLSR